VQKDGKMLPVPEEAIKKRDDLRQTWLPLAMTGKNEAPVVKLTPVFKTTPTGWKVETAVRTKQNTTKNSDSHHNN
jgi:hypothetical protein